MGLSWVLLASCLLLTVGFFIKPSNGVSAPAPVPRSAYPMMTGKFELIESENFDEYMSAIGVGWFLASLASMATPVTEISEFNGNWEIKTTTTFKTTDIKFRLGVVFKEITADGRDCDSIIMLNQDTLVQRQVCAGKDYEIRRQFVKNGQEMRMTLTAPGSSGSVVARRIYKRI